MKCKDFQEIIDSYLSDELLTETNHDVLRHMENCRDCREVIEARRAVRTQLRSAVMKAPQFQIGKNFTHNLRTQLRHEALENQTKAATSWFSLGSLLPVAAGLLLVFTFGFILFSGFDTPEVVNSDLHPHTTKEFASDHVVNVAFGDHQYCAVELNPKEPVKLSATPAKYEKAEEIVLPVLKSNLENSKLKKSHTCEYNGTKFTHLVVEKDEEILSVMLTDKEKAEKFSNDIDFHSSEKYQMARFDIKNTAVFVISDLDRSLNSQTAEALYEPLKKEFGEYQMIQSSLLMFY